MSHRKQMHKILGKEAILSRSLALARAGSAPQVIENKNTIEMNKT